MLTLNYTTTSLAYICTNKEGNKPFKEKMNIFKEKI